VNCSIPEMSYAIAVCYSGVVICLYFANAHTHTQTPEYTVCVCVCVWLCMKYIPWIQNLVTTSNKCGIGHRKANIQNWYNVCFMTMSHVVMQYYTICVTRHWSWDCESHQAAGPSRTGTWPCLPALILLCPTVNQTSELLSSGTDMVSSLNIVHSPFSYVMQLVAWEGLLNSVTMSISDNVRLWSLLSIKNSGALNIRLSNGWLA
jgi:hypothetical protein